MKEYFGRILFNILDILTSDVNISVTLETVRNKILKLGDVCNNVPVGRTPGRTNSSSISKLQKYIQVVAEGD